MVAEKEGVGVGVEEGDYFDCEEELLGVGEEVEKGAGEDYV